MIICGFPGTGKTTMAKSHGGCWVDLESTPFEKDWTRYAKVADHMSRQGYKVMVSTHKELLREFEAAEISYTVVVPPIEDKEEYIARYEHRGNTEEFITLLSDNWEKWIRELISNSSELKAVVILPMSCTIAEYARSCLL